MIHCGYEKTIDETDQAADELPRQAQRIEAHAGAAVAACLQCRASAPCKAQGKRGSHTLKHISNYTRIVAPQFNTPRRNKRSAESQGYRPDFVRYEKEKRAWTDEHPLSTPWEYQEAIAQIALRCGI